MKLFGSSVWVEIIAKAAVSPLGLAALGFLILGFVVLALVPRTDGPKIRLTAIGLLMFVVVVLFVFAIYKVPEFQAPPRMVEATTDAQDRPSRKEPPGSTASTPTSTTPSPSETSPPLKTETPPASPEPSPPAIQVPVQAPQGRVDCGQYWSGWREVGGPVGNPCTSGCARGDELGQNVRLVGFPPRPQTQHKFQCWRE